MTLYRDPAVKFGGLEVGGIRISHMSDIAKPITMALTATRANRKPFTVQPMSQKAGTQAPEAETIPNPETLDMARTAASGGTDVFTTWWKSANQIDRAAANTIKDELLELRAAADKEQAERDAVEDEPMP